jgi:hypothetical protein
VGASAPDNLEIFIQTAHFMVDRCYLNKGFDEALLTQLELWLAAHLSSTQSAEVQSEKLGDASVTYKTSAGDGLAGTRFGQQVMLLDPTGCLKNGGKSPASFNVVTC